MPLYQVSAVTSKKLDAVAEALGVKYHDEAIEILISTAYRVTASGDYELGEGPDVDGFNKGLMLASLCKVDAV
jgi:hypothetical protein